MKKLIISLSILLFITACNKKSEIDGEYPSCMQFEVNNVLNRNTTTIKAFIKKYRYQGKIVYAFYEGNIVEGQTRIYDENCLNICEFNGVGTQINTCENWDSAEFIETVWEDPR